MPMTLLSEQVNFKVKGNSQIKETEKINLYFFLPEKRLIFISPLCPKYKYRI